jgi:hypothetical protein
MWISIPPNRSVFQTDQSSQFCVHLWYETLDFSVSRRLQKPIKICRFKLEYIIQIHLKN